MKIVKWSSETLGAHEILFDDEDFEKFGAYNWTVEKPTNGSSLYAKRKYTYSPNKRKAIALHLAILAITDVSVFVDHIDGNGLNNQKGNLRIATHKQNTQNGGMQKNNTSGFKGVTVITSSKGKPYKNPSYQASFNTRHPDGTRTGTSKCFGNILEAACAYNKWAADEHGEFAKFNPVTATKYKDGTMYVHEKKTGAITERIHQFVSI